MEVFKIEKKHGWSYHINLSKNALENIEIYKLAYQYSSALAKNCSGQNTSQGCFDWNVQRILRQHRLQPEVRRGTEREGN